MRDRICETSKINPYNTATSCVHAVVLIREVSCVIGMAMSGFVFRKTFVK